MQVYTTKTLFLLIALGCATVSATNTTGDPTNIANWPPCAQNCIPIGLKAASCTGLADISCVCQNPTFSLSIAGCEKQGCSSEELQQIQALSTPLCAPVGGLGSNVVSSIVAFYSSATLSASGVPTTLPASATAGSVVSAILATATPSPNLGNPADISSYPICAQTCSDQISVNNFTCSISDIRCACGAQFRSETAACEEVTCSADDKDTTQLLAQQLCGPLYSNDTGLGASVTSAIASATAFAAAAVQSKDPTDIKSFPSCAQACQTKALAASGCGSLANRTCVCQGPIFDAVVGPCEDQTCSMTDRTITDDLSYELCAPVGGIGNVSTAGNVSNSTQPGAGTTPTPAVFTGDGVEVFGNSLGWSILAFAAMIGWQAVM